jgi:arsenate reductase
MNPSAQKFKILFLCTWNASRSIFAEYFMKDIGSIRFEAFSAGINPKGQVSPITLKVLRDKFRIDASGARSKSWEVFKDQDLDFIVSVSEQAEQTSHAFPGRPILAHWPYDDPTKVQGTSEQVEATYFRIASRIRYRLQLFNNLSFDQLDRLRIEVKMKELAEPNAGR